MCKRTGIRNRCRLKRLNLHNRQPNQCRNSDPLSTANNICLEVKNDITGRFTGIIIIVVIFMHTCVLRNF